MLFTKSREIRQLLFILVLSCTAAIGLLSFLGNHRTAAAQAATCFATIDGITVFADTTASPVQDAVNAANENDLIKVAGTCVGVNDQGGRFQTVAITKSVTLEGGYLQTDWNAAPNPNLYPTILDAAGAGRVVVIPFDDAFTVTLSNLQLTNGVEQSFSGGGVAVVGDGHEVVIRNTQIYSNSAPNDGGGLRVSSGRVTLQNSQIYSNTATGDGGGISIIENGQVAMDNVQVYGNNSGNEGGGVHVLSGTVTIVNSAILENHADDDGGGLDIEENGSVTVTQSMINRNTAVDDGGGIEVNGNLWLVDSSLNENQSDDRAAMDGDSSASIIVINGTTISGNITLDLGGGVDFDGDAMVHVSDSLIQNNQVLDAGGAGIDNFANLFITDTHIIGNFASADCGGIENNGVMTLTNVTISGNQAQSGAGVCTESASSSVIVDSRIENNIAAQNGGGALVADQSVMTLTNSTIANNEAAQAGGLFNDNGQATLTNSTVSGNQADEAGVLAQTGVSAMLRLDHTTLANNSAVVTDTGMGILSGTVTLANSILAYNGAANCAFGEGTLVSGNYNLEDGDSCGLSEPGDLTNTDPLLDVLADNGGNTETHALLASSPAINAIPVGAGGCGTEFVADQRGQARPSGEGCDIGAFEFAGFKIYLPLILLQ